MSIFSKRLKSVLRCIKIFGISKFLKQFFLAYFSKKATSFKYKLAIAAIVKNETPYILEWIEFHKLIGVEKFYIYDNESDDNLYDLLTPYIEDGTVNYHFIEGKGKQATAYTEIINLYKNEAEYIAFIDIDEFITPVKHNNLIEYIEYFKEKYGEFDALNINWLIHGFNGHYEKPDGFVIENFKKCDFKAERNNHIKTILNPRSVIMTYHPHYFVHKFSAKVKNTKGKMMWGPYNEPYYEDIIIHHYFTKSYKEHIARYNKGKADLSKTFLYEYEPDFLSKDEENSIDKFLIQLKNKSAYN